MSEVSGKHRAAPAPQHHVLRAVGHVLLAITVGLGLWVVYTYRTLNQNLDVIDTAGLLTDRPDKVAEGEPLNILVMGSDSREGDNDIDGETGGGQRSDVTILLHLSADRKSAYGVSLPRDAMVKRPDCRNSDGEEIQGSGDELVMWNEAFQYGGPLCTVQQTEQLTGVRIDHFVVVDFQGFKQMVDAVDGVEICVPGEEGEEVRDKSTGIRLRTGRYVADGQEALDYVRIRKVLSDNGDIGRMKRQQVFIAALVNKATSSSVLWRPDRLTGFLQAATRSLTLDSELGSLKRLYDLSREFEHIDPGEVQFLTVPWEWWEENPYRVIWTDEAQELWQLMIRDQPLSRRLASDAVSADNEPGTAPSPTTSPSPSDSPSESASEDPEEEPTEEESESAEDVARDNGLCA